MGEVWVAEDQLLGRRVAVKVPHTVGDDGFAERLMNEARQAAAVRHPGIAAVYDVHSDDAQPYLVLELVDGHPLSRILAEQGRLSSERTQNLVGQVAAALAAAHACGLVHRDIKPANLLVTADGVVKVTDFGIARAVDGSSVTATGLVVGTAQYLSPEQATGRPAGPASDVYALGLVAWECLAGRRPFVGDAMQVLHAHREQPVPPLPDSVPDDVAGVVIAMLDKDPGARPTAAQVAGWAERTQTVAAPTSSDTQVLRMPVPTEDPAAEAAQSTPAGPPPRRARRGAGRRGGRRTLVGAAAGVVALLVVVAGARLVHLGGAAGTPAAQADTPAVLPVASTQLFHPGGTAGDHPAEVPLAVDGKPDTAWTTQTYRTSAFGGLRPGVGLLLDLGRSRRVSEVRVSLTSPGVVLSVHAGDSAGDDLATGHAIGRASDAAASNVVRPATPVQARYVVVWLERLPEQGRHQAAVSEVTVIG